MCLIHSEKEHAWEPTVGRLGFGTARKHHYHHRRFDGEYGHLFAWWDVLCGTSGKKKVRRRGEEAELVRSSYGIFTYGADLRTWHRCCC